jgi:hypothetical protein
VNRVQNSNNIDQALRFSDAEVLAEMNHSAIGRAVGDAALNDTITLDLWISHPLPGVMGFRMPPNTAVVIVENNQVFSAPGVIDRAASLRTVADAGVHEGLHALGIGGSWEAELQVRRLTFEHAFGRVPTLVEIAQMEADMASVGTIYTSLPRTVGQTITLAGRTISF